MESIPALMHSWWVLGLRGLVAVLFGLFAVFMPGMTLLSLIALFAIYAVLAGAVAIAGAIRNIRFMRGARAADWWLLLALGVVSVVAGILATMHPTFTVLVLVMVMGLNALLTGVLDLVAVSRVRRYAIKEGTMMWTLGALASIVFGVIVIALPELGALTLVWMVAIYAIVAGLLYLAQAYLAWRVQSGHAMAATYAQGQPERRVRERRVAHP